MAVARILTIASPADFGCGRSSYISDFVESVDSSSLRTNLLTMIFINASSEHFVYIANI